MNWDIAVPLIIAGLLLLDYGFLFGRYIFCKRKAGLSMLEILIGIGIWLAAFFIVAVRGKKPQ